MVITFIGHSDFIKTKIIEQNLLYTLETFASGGNELNCYCGGYGNFDGFAAECVKRLQKNYTNIRNCLIIPYMTLEFQKRINYLQDYYDEIIYPPLEKIPKKFAILRRNEWMIDNADLVIAYIRRSWGGAAQTLKYAQKKHLPIYYL